MAYLNLSESPYKLLIRKKKSLMSVCFVAVHPLILIFCCCSVAKSYLTLYDPINYSTSGFSVLHYLPEFAQTYVH